ncbi:hypothetical protein HYV44_03405 [Candidatus Microgenomates bacterium]|nr:hypothetical protein [Candidatus Microgenomates bacterium]
MLNLEKIFGKKQDVDSKKAAEEAVPLRDLESLSLLVQDNGKRKEFDKKITALSRDNMTLGMLKQKIEKIARDGEPLVSEELTENLLSVSKEENGDLQKVMRPAVAKILENIFANSMNKTLPEEQIKDPLDEDNFFAGIKINFPKNKASQRFESIQGLAKRGVVGGVADIRVSFTSLDSPLKDLIMYADGRIVFNEKDKKTDVTVDAQSSSEEKIYLVDKITGSLMTARRGHMEKENVARERKEELLLRGKKLMEIMNKETRN